MKGTKCGRDCGLGGSEAESESSWSGQGLRSWFEGHGEGYQHH